MYGPKQMANLAAASGIGIPSTHHRLVATCSTTPFKLTHLPSTRSFNSPRFFHHPVFSSSSSSLRVSASSSSVSPGLSPSSTCHFFFIILSIFTCMFRYIATVNPRKRNAENFIHLSRLKIHY